MSGGPSDPVTTDDAASILGCSVFLVEQHLTAGLLPRWLNGGLSRADVERLATVAYPWWLHRLDPGAYWVTGERAAATLGVSESGLRLLSTADRVPFVVHCHGVRLYRREQLEVMSRSWEPWYGVTR